MPFMRPAFDAKGKESAGMFTTQIQRQIALIQKKLARQNGVA